LEDLIDFDFIPDEGAELQFKEAEPGGRVEVTTVMPVVVTSTIEVNDWRVIRDYVVEQVTKYSGSFPRDAVKEYGIFTSFVQRWGDKAMPIARVAFEVHKGVWHNAPIRIQRFCHGSDPYFSCIIARGLGEAPPP
jgi:hypothetical protein